MIADPRSLRFRLPAAFFLLSVLVVLPLHADKASEHRDPVLLGVLEMLKAEMSEPIILKWLDAQKHVPQTPSAGDMVELRQAGASDELMGRLLELSSNPGGRAADGHLGADRPAGVPGHPQAKRPQAKERPVISRDATRDDVALRTAPRKRDVADDQSVSVSFSLLYSPYVVEDEEEWQLYLYLDGKPLTYVPSSGLGGKPLRFVRTLEPGEHVLRITRERHTERRRRSMEHQASVAALTIPFRLDPGAPAEFDLSFRQTVIRSNNPLTYRFQQGSRVLFQEDIGGNPDRWQEICEDIELSREDGKEASRSVRRRLGKCVKWSELWQGGPSTERKRVLEAMSRFDYRPIPREQPLH